MRACAPCLHLQSSKPLLQVCMLDSLHASHAVPAWHCRPTCVAGLARLPVQASQLIFLELALLLHLCGSDVTCMILLSQADDRVIELHSSKHSRAASCCLALNVCICCKIGCKLKSRVPIHAVVCLSAVICPLCCQLSDGQTACVDTGDANLQQVLPQSKKP